MEIIHIAFTLFRRNSVDYYPMALTAAYRSIRQNTESSLCLHIIVDQTVPLDVRKRINSSVDHADSVNFYDAEILPHAYELSLKLDGRFSPAIVWRVWIDRYLQHLERCILIDCDFLFSANISDLWRSDLGECVMSAPLRGVPHPQALHDWLEVTAEQYFRMCCCLLDLSRLRANQLFVDQRYGFLIESASLHSSGLIQAGFLEQSVFNKFFANNCLPLIFPVIPIDRILGHPRELEWSRVLEKKEPYLLDIKGWCSSSPYSLIFWASLLCTSWSEVAVDQFEYWRTNAAKTSDC